MKPVLQNSLSYCVKEQKPCIGWADKYFKDCLCNVKDELSFGFGLVSLVCWGVAEIPQIITNFRTKSGHGISLLFLLTWIAGFVFFSLKISSFFEWATDFEFGVSYVIFVYVRFLNLSFLFWFWAVIWCFLFGCKFCSDIFNLVGCLLEPATVSSDSCPVLD